MSAIRAPCLAIFNEEGLHSSVCPQQRSETNTDNVTIFMCPLLNASRTNYHSATEPSS
jgi:hypothetical protein